jgi:hypothetical protein
VGIVGATLVVAQSRHKRGSPTGDIKGVVPSSKRTCKEDSRGLTVVNVQVGNPANPEATETSEFLVDSGAICCVVPTPVLKRLRIRPQFRGE